MIKTGRKRKRRDRDMKRKEDSDREGKREKKDASNHPGQLEIKSAIRR